MPVSVINEALHPMAPLVSYDRFVSIEEGIIAQNQTIVVGQVLGSVGVTTEETATGAAAAGNIGTTTIGSVSSTSSAQDGVYNIVQSTSGATGEFEVGRPDGTIDGVGKIGTAYAGQINFTLTSGGSPAVGDLFTVTVQRPAGQAGEQWEAWSPSATDGSQVGRAVAMYPAVTGSGQTTKIAIAKRNCEVRGTDLTWASGATTAQIQEGIVQLAKSNIIVR